MNDLVLRLFFHGLIAFVPSNPNLGGATRMTAYVMKDPMHTAKVQFEMNRKSVCPQSIQECPFLSSDPQGACCKIESLMKGTENLISWCTCYLGSGVDISFDELQIGLRHTFKDGPPAIVPVNSNAPDLSWVVRMSKVQGRPVTIDPAKLASFTRAKISFAWFSERSCQLDQDGGPDCDDLYEKDCDYNIHSFKFVDQISRTEAAHRQSLAEYAEFDLKFPFPPRLTLKYAGSDGVTLDLGCDSQGCPDVTVSNSLEPLDSFPDSCVEGVGCHFYVYYGIAAGNPGKLIPVRLPQAEALHIGPRQLFTCSVDPVRKEIEAIRDMLEGSHPKGVASRIICPMAMFDPSTQ